MASMDGKKSKGSKRKEEKVSYPICVHYYVAGMYKQQERKGTNDAWGN